MTTQLTPRASAFLQAKLSGKKAMQQDIVMAAQIRMQVCWKGFEDVPEAKLALWKQKYQERAMTQMMLQLSSRGLRMHRPGSNNSPMKAEEILDLLLYSELQAEGMQAKAALRAAQARKTIADLGALCVHDEVDQLSDAMVAANIDHLPGVHGHGGGPNCFGQVTPGFTDELFVAAELALAWVPADGRGERIHEFLITMQAPLWPYSFEAAWENWRRAHGYGR